MSTGSDTKDAREYMDNVGYLAGVAIKQYDALLEESLELRKQLFILRGKEPKFITFAVHADNEVTWQKTLQVSDDDPGNEAVRELELSLITVIEKRLTEINKILRTTKECWSKIYNELLP